ncbi:MAG TPA: hypothetical protein VMH86_15190 [Rhizomicrobium sp.]|nr:hypothetical protein [Rhizomicrobium sp.]
MSAQPPAVAVRARVLAFVAGAMTDDHEDGRTESFDATTLELIAPHRLKGLRLSVYHRPPVPEPSPWRETDAILSFDLDPGLLDEGTQIFTAAARNLKVAEGGASRPG